MAWLAASLLSLPSAAGAAVPGHGRAWELVTSGEANGAPIVGVRGWSADGDRILFNTLGPLPGAPAGDLVADATAARTPQGWTVTPVGNVFTAPAPDFTYPALLASSTDLSSWLWVSPMPLLPGAPSDPTLSLYRQQVPEGTLTLLGGGGGRSDGFTFMDASADLDHVAFQTQAHLLPADAGRTQGSDAYELMGPTLRLVGVDDAGVPLSPCGSVVGNGFFDFSRTLNAMSRDGRRIFFSAPPACNEPQRVYVREDGARTDEVSASSCTRLDCDAPQEVTFVGATPDGSQAFLVTNQQLTDDDVDEGPDLYRRTLPGGALTRLSTGPPGSAANVSQPVVRASDDGQRIYFVATGALVPGSGEEGRPNLYLSDHGTLRFVAVVDDIDLSTAEITRDGGSIVFTTADTLLPSDLDANVDVYRYDVASGALTQVSLGDSGRGNEPLDADLRPTGRFEPQALPNLPLRHLSDDGRVFFSSSEALVPEDHNLTTDVYERAGGTLGLITAGAANDGTDATLAFEGVSADGRSSFFITDESLLPADHDHGDSDLYVARLGGGFPEPTPPTPCSGDACQGLLSGRVDRPSPESLSATDAAPPAGAFGLRPLQGQARRRLAATGRTQLLLDVSAAGRVTLVARARTAPPRRAGGLTVVGRTEVTVSRAGVVHLPLRLSRAAVRTLKLRGSLLLTLTVRHSVLGAAPTSRIRLVEQALRAHGRRTR
jgi:Tol biopolymer transport system component